MDILYWTNLNQSVDIKDTKSLFYKRYLYKMEIFCPGGRTASSEDIAADLEYRKTIQRHSNYGGYWGKSPPSIHQADINQLTTLKSLILDQCDYRVRVEEPSASFYADDESVLKRIIETFDYESQERLSSVTGPRNAIHQKLLLDNKKLVGRKGSKSKDYRYLVKLKDRRIPAETKHQLCRYLQGLGDLVYLPPSSLSMLKNDYGFWGVYFYSNDESVLSFVELIVPGIVSNVQEIILADDK